MAARHTRAAIEVHHERKVTYGTSLVQALSALPVDARDVSGQVDLYKAVLATVRELAVTHTTQLPVATR